MIIYAFTKNNCAPCATVKPAVDQIRADAQALGISVHHVNIDEQDATALLATYDIRSVPALVIAEDNGTARDILRGLTITLANVRRSIAVERMFDAATNHGDPVA